MHRQFNFYSILGFIFILISASLNAQGINDDGLNYIMRTSELRGNRNQFKLSIDSTNSGNARKKIIAQAGSFLLNSMGDSIFPYWYGTAWDYNGYTDKPREGKIACGYFVSTTLKHAGFNLNRFKLAQKYSFSIVKSLSCGDSVRNYNGLSAAEFINRSKRELPDGLYVVGLESHVGFLSYEMGEVFFIHSNYREPVAVVKERAEESDALNDSRVFVLCAISGNEKLIKKWTYNSEVNIIP